MFLSSACKITSAEREEEGHQQSKWDSGVHDLRRKRSLYALSQQRMRHWSMSMHNQRHSQLIALPLIVSDVLRSSQETERAAPSDSSCENYRRDCEVNWIVNWRAASLVNKLIYRLITQDNISHCLCSVPDILLHSLPSIHVMKSNHKATHRSKLSKFRETAF